MSDSFETAGDAMFSQDQFKEWTAAAFENEIARYLMTKYSIPGNVRKELAAVNADSGSVKVTVEQVTLLLNFPMPCVCRYVGGVAKDSTVSKLFTDFGHRRFMVTYYDVEDSYRESGRQPAMIFNWPWLGGVKALVVHGMVPDWSKPGARLTWVNPVNDKLLIVEPLPNFLDNIDVRFSG